MRMGCHMPGKRLSKDAISGEWKETQLFEHLQAIINKHREYFDGEAPE